MHAWAQRAAVCPTRAQRLDDEQRVSLGLTVEPLRVLAAECGAGEHLRELGRLRSAQRPQFELAEALPRAQTDQQTLQRVVAVELLLPCRGHHQQPRGGPDPQQIVQKLTRLSVTVLEIVHDKQQGAGDGEDRRADGLEHPMSLVSLGQCTGVLEVGHLDEQLRKQSGELGEPGAVEPVPARPQRLRTQPGDHRTVGECTLRRVAARLGRGSAMPRTPHPEVLDEPGLPHPRLAVHQDELRLACIGGPPRRDELRPLTAPPDQPTRGLRHHRRPGFGLAGKDRFVDRVGFRGGFDAQLPGQDGAARVIDPQRPRPIATAGMQSHQLPVGFLP